MVLPMILCQLSIAPVGNNVHLHKYVKKVIKVIKKYEVKYEVNDMSTILEVNDLDTLFTIVKDAHSTLFNEDVFRIITEIKIDERKDKNAHLGSKRKAVLNSLND